MMDIEILIASLCNNPSESCCILELGTLYLSKNSVKSIMGGDYEQF